MKVDNLYLELTRMCTIECEHCLRGDRRNEYMSVETINNIFKDVTEVEFLLLTGGEPLLALKQIKEVLKVVKEKNIKINRILLITNCTVLNDDVMNVLEELSNISDFNLRLSYDMFHYIELTRLNLLEKRKENAEILKNKFKAEEYSDYKEASKFSKQLIFPIGKAACLTDKRLDEINIMANTNYAFNKIEPLPVAYDDIEYDNDVDLLYGIISVDVNGNVVSYSLPFDDEDLEAKESNSNVNNNSLLDATFNYLHNRNLEYRKLKLQKIYEKLKNN